MGAPWEAGELLVWVLVSGRTRDRLAFLLRSFRLCSQHLAPTHLHPFTREGSRMSRAFPLSTTKAMPS